MGAGGEPHAQHKNATPFGVEQRLMLSIIWSCPDLSADRLVFNLTWTVWVVIGTWLEERDLAADFGDDYRAYQRSVPMLIPWRRPDVHSAAVRTSSTDRNLGA